MENIEEAGHLNADELAKLLPEVKVLESLEVFFKAIADPTRLKILMTITEAGNMQGVDEHIGICVHDIAEIVQMSQSAVSHQLRVLRHADLISKEKRGKHVYYSLSDSHVESIINQSIEHINEHL